MVIRARFSAIARSWSRRVRPRMRSIEHTVYDQLHDLTTEPGLTGVTDSGFVDNDGVRVAWYEVGPQDAEATVVFIHGYCLSAESFYSQVNDVRRNYPSVRCLLVDVRGHGQSTHVAPAQCTVRGAADDVLAVIAERAAEGPLVLLGHSMGGMIALNLLRRAPRDVFDRVEGMALVATSMQRFAAAGVARMLESKTLGAVYRVCLKLPRRLNRVRFEVAALVAPAFAALLQGFPQMDKLQFHVAMLLDTPMSSYAGFFDDLVEHSEFGATARLRSVPGEIVVGQHDIVTPRRQSEVIARHWPGSTLTVVDGAGHMVILEEPSEVSKALGRVLDRVLGG